MPRFSVGFRRKSTAGDLTNGDAGPPPPSFRVIERHTMPTNNSFDGGANSARSPASPLYSPPLPGSSTQGPIRRKPTHLEIADDNMFAGLNGNRGSNISNTTQATSTDNSSRHSNASTAPSSADMAQTADEANKSAAKQTPYDAQGPAPARGPSTKSIGASLFKASRTFSFGSKKHTIPPPTEEPVPDLPPMLTLSNTTQTVSETPPGTATDQLSSPAKSVASKTTQNSQPIDLGSDFSAMFAGMEKRESTADTVRPSDEYSRTSSFSTRQNSSRLQPEFKYSNRPSDIVEDEDAKLLRDSFNAMKFLSDENNGSGSRNRRGQDAEDSYGSRPSTSIASNFDKEDNLFDNTTSRFGRVTHRYAPRAAAAPKNRVMTPAQFEHYRQAKERGSTVQASPTTLPASKNPTKDDDDDDEINYEEEEDEAEKSRQQSRQRRKQEAHMAVYRQQMMKVTGEPAAPIMSRPGLPTSLSSPHLNVLKSPSPNLPNGASDEDDDEEIPLAVLQAHGFPSKNRPPTRLSHMGSNPQLRAGGRAPSVMGEPANTGARRQSTLPAFARNLPQDPFSAQNAGRPGLRESMSFHDGPQNSQTHGPLPPGGLIGVIASEERSRAMRRGSPNIDGGRGISSSPTMANGQGFDPLGGIPPHMMYNPGGLVSSPTMGGGGLPYNMSQMGGMPGMPGMQMPMPSPGEQAQLQMTQQMQQFMQMQMQFMQMMAMNQNGGGPGMPMQQQMPGMPQMPMPFLATQSMTDLSARHSFIGEPQPERLHPSNRTMSMVQPSSASMLGRQSFGGAASIRGMPMGYAPSIAPSERSNVGLPGRYRPVSQAIAPKINHQMPERMSMMSGAIGGGVEPLKQRASVNIMARPVAPSDEEDDDEGWEAMKAKREKKRSIWRSRKSTANELVI